MASLELAVLVSGKLREARALSDGLEAGVLQFIIDMAILESLDVEMQLLSKQESKSQ